MSEHSQKAFTTDKLRKFEVSGRNGNAGNGDKGASADDYGRKAARTSDSSAFAAGGAAKAPSLGRAGRAKGGRISQPAVASADFEKSKTGGNYPGKIPDNEGGKSRNLSILTDGGPRSYGDRPLLVGHGDQNAKRAKGGKVSRAKGGRTEISDLRANGGRTKRAMGGAMPPMPVPGKPMPGAPFMPKHPPGLMRAKGGRIGRESGGATAQQRFTNRTQYDTGTNYLHDYVPAINAFAKEDADELGIGSDAQGMSDRAKGGRIGRAHGGKASKGKGKTVVNVIVGGHDQQQPPMPPPHPMMPPMQPPPQPLPPQAASGPRPPMMPPGMPGAPGAAGPPGPPGGGMPPGMPPPGMPRAHGGRTVMEKYGSGSGQGRMEKARRENHGKVKLGR